MNKKTGYIFLTIAVVIILALVWGLVAVASTAGTGASQNAPDPKQVVRTLSGKTITEDRADVYKAAVEVLEATNAPAGQEEYMKLLSELDKAVIQDVPTDFLSKVRFADVLDEDALKVTTYQAVITFAALAKASSKDSTIASVYADGPMTIMVDQEVGVAQVPMNIFVNQDGQANTFSLEFVFIAGEWKLAPYSVLDQLRLSLALQQQSALTDK